MKKYLKQLNSMTLVMIALFIVGLLLPVFIQKSYMLSILVMTVYVAGCSLAWSILGGMVGQVSLGHGAFAAIGAYIGTIFVTYMNVSPWIAMGVAFVVVGGTIALLMFPCFGLKGAYFSLTTIAFGEAFRNIFTNWEFVGAGQGMMLPLVRAKDESLLMLAFRSKASYYYVGLFLLVLFYLIVKLIDSSKLGYALKTIREDEGTAEAIGIKPIKYKVIATFISAGMVAVMGVFYATYIRYINPELMMMNKSLEFVLPAVIGGISTVEGPVIGALIIVPLSQYLNSLLGSKLPGSNLVVYAMILIGVVLFRPTGLLGWWKERQQKMKIYAEKKAFERLKKGA
ncbi:MAG: branched-chain amino acid ABC transporter permease [Eubacteriales bacterium]|nr:branched-chain amino acid ABC transporter permease [Eubacteriales bacterium]